MGGKESMDFLAPSGSGENVLVTCENGDYAADLEIALGVPRAPEFPAALDEPEEIETPGVTTIEALAEHLGIDAAATSKAMPVMKQDGTLVLALDPRRRPARGGEARGGARRPTSGPRPTRRSRRGFGADPGSLGPVGFNGEIVADETLREGQFVAGANATAGICAASSTAATSRPQFADLRQPREGDRCPDCGGALRFETAIEVGHIFKFGTRYSEPLGATFLDEDGVEKPLIGG